MQHYTIQKVNRELGQVFITDRLHFSSCSICRCNSSPPKPKKSSPPDALSKLSFIREINSIS